jgi:RNA polymerase sigma factor (sigma-70 family)
MSKNKQITVSNPNSSISKGEVVKKYQSPLRAFIRSRVPSKEVAEDILQDVFYNYLKAEELLYPIEHISGFLYKVSKNLIINWQKKKKETIFSDYANNDDENAEDIDALVDILLIQNDTDDSGPEAEYFKKLVWNEIERALAELPDGQREAFVQIEMEGISAKELSQKSGVPVSTLLSRKHYAVLYLRQQLQYLYDELNDA